MADGTWVLDGNLAGPAGSVAVGTVTTGDPGTDAEVTNSGTTTAAVLDFVIPQGEKGDAGLGSVAIDTGAGTDPLKFNGTELVSALSDLDGRYLLDIVLNALNYAPTCAGDGTTTDTTALQAEINTLKFLVLTKKYKVTAPLLIPAGHPGIMLAAGCQVIKAWNAATSSDQALFCNGARDGVTGVFLPLEGFSITGPGKIYNASPTTQAGRIFALYGHDMLFDHFTVDGIGNGGFGVLAGDRMRIGKIRVINPVASTGVAGIRFLGGVNFRCLGAHVDSGDATFQFVPSATDAYMPNNLDTLDGWYSHCTGSSSTAAVMQVSLHDDSSDENELITITGGPTGGSFTLTYFAGLITITGGPTGGSFTLTYGGQTTSAIAYNASAATVQAALVALSSVGAGLATVTGSAGAWTATFTGTANGKGRLTATSSLTGGITPAITVGQTTAAIAWNATAATVQSALQALSNVGSGNATVTGSAGGPWTAFFSGAAGGGGQLAQDPTGLTGGTSPNLTVSFLPTMISSIKDSGYDTINVTTGHAQAVRVQNLDSSGTVDVDFLNCKVGSFDLEVLNSTFVTNGSVTIRARNSRFSFITVQGTATNPIAAVDFTDVSTTSANTATPKDGAYFDGCSKIRWLGGTVDMVNNPSSGQTHGVTIGNSVACSDARIDFVTVKNIPSSSNAIGFNVKTCTGGHIRHCPVSSAAGATAGKAFSIAATATDYAVEDNDPSGAFSKVTWSPTDALSSYRRNKGSNPVGNITAPTFPATTVAYTNTTGFDLQLFVTTGSGVTVSAIALGGTATGASMAASSQFTCPLDAGGTITFTYAGGTPTWKFFAK